MVISWVLVEDVHPWLGRVYDMELVNVIKQGDGFYHADTMIDEIAVEELQRWKRNGWRIE